MSADRIQPVTLLQGRGASRGEATGSLFKAMAGTSAFPDQFSSPTILLVANLDPSLPPLIPSNTLGVLAVNGSVGCHGSGVLREMGIPCVVDVPPEMTSIADGTVITMNGTEGVIVVLGGMSSGAKQDDPLFGDFSLRIGLEDVACYRPTRSYQRLRFDMLALGWTASPQLLFGLSQCRLDLSSAGVVHIHNGPKLASLRETLLANPDCFFRAARFREKDIQSIKMILASVSAPADCGQPTDLLISLDTLVTLYYNLVKYIYLTQFIADDLISEWIDFSRSVSQDLPSYIQRLLWSDYNRNAVASGRFPGKSTSWTLPSSSPFSWQGKVFWTFTSDQEDYFLRAALARSLESGSGVLSRYAAFREIVPTMYQMAEEHYYVSSSICSHINHLLDAASISLFGAAARIEVREQIYLMQLEELRAALGATSHLNLVHSHERNLYGN